MRNEFLEDDSNLVEACINGDFIAWANLIKKYSNLIHISIDRCLKKYGLKASGHDIEDIRQNVLASLWKGGKLRNIRNRANISYWLAIVAGNMAIEHMRKMRASDPPLAISIYDKITDEKELADLLPSAALTASDELIKDEISKKLNDAIEALPVKERLITKLNMLYDKPYHEIADILNLPKGTVSSYIKRAREKLKKSLRDWPRP